MALEHCHNCEHTIGKLERAFVFNNNIVCSECYAKLNKIKDEHSNIRMVKCPYCAEEIQDGSTLCRYCKSNLNPSMQEGSWIGRLLIICGMLGATYFFFFFDTSVPMREGDRINNLGLMADRQNGIIFSFGVAIIGVAIEAFARFRK